MEKKNLIAIIVSLSVALLVLVVLFVGLLSDKTKEKSNGGNVGQISSGSDKNQSDTNKGENSNENKTQGNTSDSNKNDNNNDSKLEITPSVSNGWQNGNDYFKQYDFVVGNVSSQDIEKWTICIEVADNTTVESFWNCNCKIENGKLYLDANGFFGETIKSGSTVKDMGVIIKSTSDAPLTDKVKEDITIAPSQSETQSQTEKETQTETQKETQTETQKQESTTSNVIVPQSGTPVKNHGQLRVEGTQLVDEHGKTYRLCGVSTHGIGCFGNYVNKDTFQYFRDDWGANTIRIALYVREYNGYLTGGDKTQLKNLVKSGVDYATNLGMYVIIDWHVLSFNPNETKSEAKEFFAEMAKTYDSYNNVIYEVCNEPTGAPWSNLKPYGNELVSTIRQYDKDAVIIMGTNTWSQDVDEVIGNRLNDDKNVMYALHFYAATHTDGIRNKLTAAYKAGIPVFVSECSICTADGNGYVDYNQADTWFKLLKEYNVSYMAWNISNKNEKSALIAPGCNKLSGFAENELSETGKWFRSRIRKDMGLE